MRMLLSAVLVVAACAPGEQKSAAPAGAGQKYVGTWEGRAYRSASDSGVAYRTVLARVADGTLRGTLTYPGTEAPPAPIRVREYSDTALVQEIGPYHSRVSDRDVITRAVGHVKGDSLSGSFEMRPPGGGDVILQGTFRAKKVS